HGRGHWFNPSIAHHSLPGRTAFPPLALRGRAMMPWSAFRAGARTRQRNTRRDILRRDPDAVALERKMRRPETGSPGGLPRIQIRCRRRTAPADDPGPGARPEDLRPAWAQLTGRCRRRRG